MGLLARIMHKSPQAPVTLDETSKQNMYLEVTTTKDGHINMYLEVTTTKDGHIYEMITFKKNGISNWDKLKNSWNTAFGNTKVYYGNDIDKNIITDNAKIYTRGIVKSSSSQLDPLQIRQLASLFPKLNYYIDDYRMEKDKIDNDSL